MDNIEAIVFSKPSCPFCVKAKDLLNRQNIDYEEKIVGVDVTKSDIQSMVDRMGIKTVIRTVPQIFFKNETTGSVEYIGGFTELNQHFRN